MAYISNEEFVTKLIDGTKDGKLDWQPTAQPELYSASLGGKWTLSISGIFEGVIRQHTGEPVYTHVLKLQDSTGQEILRVRDDQDNRISELYELARRRALKVDEALADFIKELGEPQF